MGQKGTPFPSGKEKAEEGRIAVMDKTKSDAEIFKNFSLKTERLRIRPFEMHDLFDLQAIVCDAKVMEFLPEAVMSLEETRGVLKWVIDCYSKNSCGKIIKFTAAVEHSDQNRLIGWCGLGPLEFNPNEIEIFCGFASEFWRQDYASEAVGAMLRYGFETIGLEKIVAVVDPGNIASKRLIEKAAFVYQNTAANMPEEYGFYEGFLFYSMNRDDIAS
jgi:ribosomal-protein-alanine N-acetyltransferase